MDARFLLAIFDSIYLLALASWVGSILFFSFGVAPILSRALPSELAAKLVRVLFPRYYAWGATSGAIALAAFVSGPLCYPEFRGPRVAAQAWPILAGILLMLYGGNSLTPALNAAGDAGPPGRERFDRLHRRSVQLNGVVLLIGVGLLIAFATRPAPRTAGIVEPTPTERIRRIEERYRGAPSGAASPPPAGGEAAPPTSPRGPTP